MSRTAGAWYEPPRVLGRAGGVLGEVVLRERPDGVHELIVNGAFLMDTAETSTERLLAGVVRDRHADPRRVLVAGLGLGATLAELLADPRVARVDVVEIEPALVGWLREGRVPGVDRLLADPRVRVEVADVRRWLTGTAGPYDAAVLDVDNGPGFLVHHRNAALYHRAALAGAARLLSPGGVLVVWSSAPAPQLRDVLAGTVGATEELRRPVVRRGRELDYYLYLATRPGGSTGEPVR